MDRALKSNVTIVIPAYLRNDQDIHWIIEALQSAVDQTVVCAVIIVENGSNYLPDLKGDVTIMHSEKGLSKARNTGIRAATTELFFPLDCNDWLPDNAIEIAIKKLPEKGFLYGSTMLFNFARGMGDQLLYDAKPYDFSEVMKMVYFPNGALQRRADWERIGGYREDLPFLEDWDYWMTAGELGICGTAIPDLLYWYRRHSGMVSENQKSAEWERVKKQIQNLHRNIYRGVFPPMCCGNRTSLLSPQFQPQSLMMDLPGSDGMVEIEYVGANAGKMPWYGPVTNTRYIAGGNLKRIYVDVRDAITNKREKPGLLELLDHGKKIFVEAAA